MKKRITTVFSVLSVLWVLSMLTPEVFAWDCVPPEADLIIYPAYYDYTSDKYYVCFARPLLFDATGSSDPDCPYCTECGSNDCSGDDVLNGIKKFRWDFGDSSLYSETCSSATDGDFDGLHTHEYSNTGPKTLDLDVTRR